MVYPKKTRHTHKNKKAEKEKKNMSVPIVQLDKNYLRILQVFPSYKKAGEAVGSFDIQNLWSVCHGRRMTHKGFGWKRITDISPKMVQDWVQRNNLIF